MTIINITGMRQIKQINAVKRALSFILIIQVLCPKSPSVRGLVAPLPVRLLFKYLSNNAFCLSQCGI